MKDDDFSYENLKNLNYIDCVEKEVTRYYGPVTQVFAREVKEDHYLNGVPLKKGIVLSVEVTGVHYC